MTKLIFKIIFKLCVPIICMIGVTSYGVYMRGGDPGAMLGKLAESTVDRVKSSANGAGDKVKSLASSNPASGSGSSKTIETKVYKWTDANGVTHFGSAPPEGIASDTLNIKTRKASAPASYPSAQGYGQATPAAMKLGPDGQPLPGVAGMNLPTGGDPAEMLKFLQSVQGQQVPQ